MLPSCHSKSSTCDILGGAIDYIRCLETQLKSAAAPAKSPAAAIPTPLARTPSVGDSLARAGEASPAESITVRTPLPPALLSSSSPPVSHPHRPCSDARRPRIASWCP